MTAAGRAVLGIAAVPLNGDEHVIRRLEAMGAPLVVLRTMVQNDSARPRTAPLQRGGLSCLAMIPQSCLPHTEFAQTVATAAPVAWRGTPLPQSVRMGTQPIQN